MKNYYFNAYLERLDENVNCDDVCFIVVNNVKEFKNFSDEINLIDCGVTSTGIYHIHLESEEWRELNPRIKSPVFEILNPYLNKKENNTKKNNTADKKENTFNYVIEFKKGGSMSKNNCQKSFHSLDKLCDSIIFNKNTKRVIIEVN